MKRKQLRAAGKISHSSKDSAASLHDTGLRHFQSGLFAVAEERIQRALALDPQHAGSLYLAGRLHAQANKVDLAIDFTVRAIRIDQGREKHSRKERQDESQLCIAWHWKWLAIRMHMHRLSYR